MGKRKVLNPLQDHDEWVDHMYNPGYWVNRVTSRDIAGWKYTRRHAVRIGVAGMLLFGFGAFAFAFPAIEEAGRSGISFIRIMFDELTIWVELYLAAMFVVFLALFVRGIRDKLAARHSSHESDAA